MTQPPDRQLEHDPEHELDHADGRAGHDHEHGREHGGVAGFVASIVGHSHDPADAVDDALTATPAGSVPSSSR